MWLVLHNLQELFNSGALEQHNGTVLVASARALGALCFEHVHLLRATII